MTASSKACHCKAKRGAGRKKAGEDPRTCGQGKGIKKRWIPLQYPLRPNERKDVNKFKAGDELDFVLSSAYEHNKVLFPDPCEIYFQPITLEDPKKKPTETSKHGLTSKTHIFGKPASTGVFNMDHIHAVDMDGVSSIPEKVPRRLFPDHPLIIGGVIEKVHPSSIKLMNSSHHSPQTNAGYLRQDRDGNVFQY